MWVIESRSGPCDGGSSQRRAPATDVFNHHRSEQGLHLVRQWAANGIERTTWRERNNESDRPCWIALRRSKAREDRKRCSADEYLQNLPTGKPQTALPIVRLPVPSLQFSGRGRRTACGRFCCKSHRGVPLIKLMPGVRECLTAEFMPALRTGLAYQSALSLAETAKSTASALIKRGIKGVFPARVRSRREPRVQIRPVWSQPVLASEQSSLHPDQSDTNSAMPLRFSAPAVCLGATVDADSPLMD